MFEVASCVRNCIEAFKQRHSRTIRTTISRDRIEQRGEGNGYTDSFPNRVCIVTAPTPPPPVPGGCITPDPFVAFGAGTCINGGWFPPGSASAPTVKINDAGGEPGSPFYLRLHGIRRGVVT